MAVFSSERLLPCSPPRKTLRRRRHPAAAALRLALSPPLPLRWRLAVIGAQRPPSSQATVLSPSPSSPDDLIIALAKSRETEALAFDCYQKARAQPGFRPQKQTLNALARCLLKCRQWDAVWALAEDLRAMGVFPDGPACARLVRGCIKARKFKLAEALLGAFLSDGSTAAVPAVAAAMAAFNKLHMYSTTARVHAQARAAGAPPDPAAFCAAMDAHRRLGDPDQVLALFLELESAGGLTARAYAVLCDALGRSGRAFEALRRFREMAERGFPPDAAAYSSLIGAFAMAKEAEIAEDLFQEARAGGLAADPGLFLRLVLMHVETGALDKTLAAVRAMRELDLRVSDCVFSAVVNGHAKKLGLRAAVRAFEELTAMGCAPGQVGYASAVGVYARLGLLPAAEALFQEMTGRGFDRCVVAYATMISAYGKAGKLREAGRLLAAMKEKGCEPNAWVYNALIDAHGRAGDLRRVERLWKEMRRRRVAADRVSYTAMIGAYARAGELGACARLYEELRLSGAALDRAVAGIMVGVFARGGRVDELVRLLQEAKAEGLRLDERLHGSAVCALRDAGLEAQARWLQQSFPVSR
ncbi:pentatricopeptide repeat (PPR-like) superfamily protein [Wolffia australiana]